ncbi:unnamed protein product [Lactuca saligna]|uniref:Serine-threonine/tyrosine-protein kinase catalytic domain-containing protein n=1 Tax=Lactuca saligna TaxID=75948 RepID=A0AA35VIS0_LACSI|nr:unnamed protein product [Lactuca saligna]
MTSSLSLIMDPRTDIYEPSYGTIFGCHNVNINLKYMLKSMFRASAIRPFKQGRYQEDNHKVYTGTLPNGQLVAVKRAQLRSTQGGLEFKTNIELLSRVHHKNVDGLVGFCFDEGEQMLVYEFIVNGILKDSLSEAIWVKVVDSIHVAHLDNSSKCGYYSVDVVMGFKGDTSLAITFHHIYALDIYKDARVTDRVDVDAFLSFLLRLPRGGMVETQWNELMSILRSVTTTSSLDFLGWSHDPTDLYTVSSAHSFIDASSLIIGNVNAVWKTWVPIRLNILLWWLRLGRILTRERLSARGSGVATLVQGWVLAHPNKFEIRQSQVESILHIFLVCPSLKDIRLRIANWWDVDLPNVLSIMAYIS